MSGQRPPSDDRPADEDPSADAVVVVDEPGNGPLSRLEQSSTGRAVVASFIAFVLVALLISNVPPESEAYRTLEPRVAPFLQATGLLQSWHLFAPTPRRQTRWLDARLTYSDGSIVRWERPRSDRYIGTYRGYRWQKWASSVLAVDSLWEPTATWVARTNQRNGKWPVQVVLLKRIYLFPGLARPGRAAWKEEAFFIAHFTPDGPRGTS